MIPQWVAGAAVRDAMIRRPRGGGDQPSGDKNGFRGVLSFLGLVLIVGATFAKAQEGQMSGLLALVLAILIGIVAWRAAYRTHGPVGMAGGVGVAALAGYSLYSIETGSGGSGGGMLWPIVVFVLMGIDQWALKSRTQ